MPAQAELENAAKIIWPMHWPTSNSNIIKEIAKQFKLGVIILMVINTVLIQLLPTKHSVQKKGAVCVVIGKLYVMGGLIMVIEVS